MADLVLAAFLIPVLVADLVAIAAVFIFGGEDPSHDATDYDSEDLEC